MLKRTISVITAAGMLSTAFVINSAASGGEYNVNVYYCGEAIEFDAAPEIKNDRTFVPLRAIAEALDADVGWDGETETVTLAKDEVKTSLVIGSTQTKTEKDGKTYDGFLEAEPYIKNERTMVPLRFISETFGMDVEWDGDKHSVYITAPISQPVTTEAAELEPTPEPSAEPMEDTSSVPVTDEERYASMYKGTEYEFVRNIGELTEDYELDALKYKSKQHWGYGIDADGNGVMYLVRNVKNTCGETEVEFMLDKYNNYNEDELINISFDIFMPSSGGSLTLAFVDSYKRDSSILQLVNSSKTGLTFKILPAVDFLRGVYDDYSPSLYFNNNTNDDIAIRNGAHIDILINPYRGKMYTAITNNTNAAEPIKMTSDIEQVPPIMYKDASSGFIASRFKLYGLKFSVKFTEKTKDAILDNLITNIVKKHSN